MKYWLYFLGLLLVLVTIINYSLNTKLKIIERQQSTHQNTSNDLYFSHKIIEESAINERYLFDTSRIFLRDEKGNNVIFDSNLFASNSLYFALDPNFHCSSCIIETFQILLNVKKPIIILVLSKEMSDLIITKQKFSAKFSYYLISDSQIIEQTIKLRKPFLFEMQEFNHSKNVFFVEPDHPELTIDYLNFINVM